MNMIKQLMLMLLTSMFLISSITSNRIFDVPVKEVIFILIALFTLVEIFQGKISVYVRESLIFAGMFFFVFVWGIIGISNGFEETVIQHAAKIGTAIVLILMFYTIIKSKYINNNQMYNLVKWMFWFGILFKFTLEIVYMLGMMTNIEIVSFIKEVSSVEVMSLDIADGYMLRMGTILDVIPLSIFPFFILNECGRKRILIWICVLIYAYINFSRIYIIQFIVLSLILLVPDRLSHTNIWKYIGGGLVTFLLLLVISTSSIDFSVGIENRFVGVDAEVSDFYRYEQISVFSQEIPKTYLMGNGLGSYITGFVRSDAFPFLYELEYLAIVYQFGLLGFLYLLLIYLFIFSEINVKELDGRYKLLIISNLLFFLIRPAFNPMLLASSSSMALVCFFIFAKLKSDNFRN